MLKKIYILLNLLVSFSLYVTVAQWPIYCGAIQPTSTGSCKPIKKEYFYTADSTREPVLSLFF